MKKILDPGSGKVVQWKVYNRDGQGLSFYSWKQSPPSAGVDLNGIFYRLARDNPEGYFCMSGTPKEWGAIVPEPQPTYRLQRFSNHNKVRMVGKKVVDGKPCVVNEITKNMVVGRLFFYSVWRIYGLAQPAEGQEGVSGGGLRISLDGGGCTVFLITPQETGSLPQLTITP